MNRKTHPNFVLGLVSLLLLFMGLGFKANGYNLGDYIWYASIALSAIHWIWAIIDVFSHQTSGSQSRVFWIILVVALPVVGGLLYYIMSKTMRM